MRHSVKAKVQDGSGTNVVQHTQQLRAIREIGIFDRPVVGSRELLKAFQGPSWAEKSDKVPDRGTIRERGSCVLKRLDE